MKHAIALLCATLALIAMLSAAAAATQIVYVTLEEMAQRSDLVVRGKVSTVRSFWNEKHTKIFTKTTISIDETYKGDARAAVDILELGGTVDGIKVTVDGALQWKEGEEVLLFLEPYVQGAKQVTGFTQGKFAIERDPKTGAAFVTRPSIAGVKLAKRTAAEGPAPEAPVRMPLERFVESVLGAGATK